MNIDDAIEDFIGYCMFEKGLSEKEIDFEHVIKSAEPVAVEIPKEVDSVMGGADDPRARNASPKKNL